MLLQEDFDITASQYGLLYSLYSIPNILLVFLGGVLGDKLGLRLAGLIFVSLSFAGSIIVALSPFLIHSIGRKGAYIILASGRFIFGMGAESLNVTQSAMIARWFFDTKDMAMAFGIVLSMSRLGDFLALNLGGKIALLHTGLNYRLTLIVGACLCGLSFFCVFIYSVLDKLAERMIYRPPLPKETINFKAVKHFDPRFWLISSTIVIYYSAVMPFVAIGAQFTSYTWPNKYSSNFITPTPVIILSSMILSPILGKFLDTVGKRPYFVVIGCLAIVPAYFLLAFTDLIPYISAVIIGISFSLVPSALWPSIPLIIPEASTGTAYGLMTSIQNFGLALVNFLVNLIIQYQGYRWAMVFFACIACVGLLLGELLIIFDYNLGKQLCKTKSPIRRIDEKI
eukprot:TRINITY_DN1173_c0_g1_i2.p1 TRINITY_DN1173_c0_g1~~TRINITY_DN1173_c0_g1_i2.p1  ORF type:complete len:397 (-),score=29.20 TRINITY_DN1173_c0_g1_i2:54-1244(-)